MTNGNSKPKRTLHFWIFPAVPLLIVLIWAALFITWYTVGLSRTVMTPIILGTVVWFVVWLIRAAQRD